MTQFVLSCPHQTKMFKAALQGHASTLTANLLVAAALISAMFRSLSMLALNQYTQAYTDVSWQSRAAQ